MAKKEDYESLWNLMDRIDQKHADRGMSEWRTGEVEHVLSQLDKFHSPSYREKLEYTGQQLLDEITIVSDRIHKDIENADYLIMNRLKDAVHKMWQQGFVKRKRHEGYSWDSDWYKQIDKLAKGVTNLTNRKQMIAASNKIGYKKYHSAEAYEKNELLRFKIIYNALEEIAKGSGDILGLMIHDMYQNFDGCKFVGEDMQEVIQARQLKIITEEHFIRLQKLASELLPYYYYRGEDTWHRDDLERQLRFETEYVIHYLKWVGDREVLVPRDKYSSKWVKCEESEVRDKIACGRILCDNRIVLSKKEIIAMRNGKGVPLKYCCDKCKKIDNGEDR